MSWWFIPIRLPAAEIKVRADRRLVFQVLTAWGAAGPDGKPISQVLLDEGNRKLIAFRTMVKDPFGIKRTHHTQERVTVREPESIEFEGVKGPVPRLNDRFTLEEWGSCTRWRYESTVALHGSVLGWLFGMIYVRPLTKRFMREHQEELRDTMEARASRSRQYPQMPCPDEEEAVEHPAEARTA